MATQYLQSPSGYAHGIAASFTEPSNLDVKGAYSVNQLAIAKSFGGQTAVIEFGWIVSPASFGDTRPHIFVALRVDGPVCYIGLPGEAACDSRDYTQLSQTWHPGDAVGATGRPEFYHVGYYAPDRSWWIQYRNEWMLKVHESHWSRGFAQGDILKWYGEVALRGHPCTPMGNGRRGEDPLSASVSGMSYEVLRGNKSVALSAEADTFDVTDARYWSMGHMAHSGKGINGFHYGGPFGGSNGCGSAR